ncbi:alanyl-tRNA synthetase [Raphidocelis subcapitata]|uniref:Alanine--tRNA ligase n=1 Tax=Raphidocelis subcapitata TaxID=307507 RepID=A0A2V0P359_9CHLO|nr:alanyl-tRNA synthetase [Raphidocelis subcapitata]|eukprot:GBF94304.1 alanyl-tRNA synthetase [Raphidocelis subcapitata]
MAAPATEWPGARVRKAFNDFFVSKGHTYWPSNAVVPLNDPTLLFTNAGMNQFKPVFLGTVDPNSEMGRLKRACNSQKCIRAGGKHNDLDDVGKDVYHHTFFEMLGNWSFGDYFKEEAITWAWELLTEVYKLPGERLYATYFGGDAKQGLPVDEEARAIWLRHLPEERVLPFGCKDNFWEMGDQGPCGPCTEIHFDRVGGRDASHLVNMDDPNVLEIWNNVFIQFNREADGSLITLPAQHVDTGMGLERVTSVLQGKMSNYATDLFMPIFDQIRAITGAREYTDKRGVISGQDAFLLWDTYGFPLDLTQLMAEEAGLRVDGAGFEAAMEEAREKSRAGGRKAAGVTLKFEAEATGWLQARAVPLTNDAPKYRQLDAAAKVLAILGPGGYVKSSAELEEGSPIGLVLDKTSFYAESGGQVGDTGAIVGPSGAIDIGDCQVAAGYVLHTGTTAPGASVSVGDDVTSRVDYERRGRVMPNHTFTHVLNWALREVLGEHVDQKGSIVAADKLRFDFSNNGAVDAPKLAKVEAICREWVAAGLPVSSREVALADAKGIKGLRAVFGEVYPDPVRVVAIGPEGGVEALLAAPSADANFGYSVEFCGGTHLTNTAQAGAFALISEEGIAKGVRRIVAFTADDARAAIKEGDALAAAVAAAGKLPAGGAEFERRVNELKGAVDTAVIPAAQKAEIRDSIAALARRLLDAQRAAASAAAERATEEALAAADAAAAAGARHVVRRVGVGADAKALAAAVAAIAAKHGDALAALLVSVDEEKGKVLAYAGVPDALLPKIKAPEWLGAALSVVGGKGGGKPAAAQGQGSEVGKADDAVEAAEKFAALAL